MTGINHIVTGAAIGAAISQPVLALPLAFISHFVLDSMPHFGFPDWEKRTDKQNKLLNYILVADVLAVLAVVAIFIAQSAPAMFYIAGFVAFSPDAIWIYRFFLVDRKIGATPESAEDAFSKFHSGLQTRERPSGIYVEIAYLVVISVVLAQLWI